MLEAVFRKGGDSRVIVRCQSCRGQYSAGPKLVICPFCSAARRPEERRCSIAHALGSDCPCPPGGCRLAQALDRTAGQVADPCPIGRIAPPHRSSPLVLHTLDAVRREIEASGEAGEPEGRTLGARRARHAAALARWVPRTRAAAVAADSELGR
jgi:hypothetical protein